MPVRYSRLLCLAGLIAFAAAGFPRAANATTPLELAQGGNIMQCMEQCIRSEGKAEKSTCKSRCANISARPAKPRDCMGIFKSCNKTCASTDRACKKACKDALMTCS